MKKARGIVSIVSVLVCILLILSGCSNYKGADPTQAEASNPLTHERNIKMIEKTGISEILIYKSEAHGTVGQTLLKKLTSGDEFTTVLKALKTAEEIEGMLNTSTPDFDVVMQLQNKESFAFHFWLQPTDESGMFTNVNNTGRGYTVSKASVQALLEYIK